MSIYFIRHAGLVKIGYSHDLRARISAIMRSIPSNDVTLIGYMPGDRDVEAHLHQVFAEHRFSGEWYFFAPSIVDFARLVLTEDLPPAEVAPRPAVKRTESRSEREKVAQELREAAAIRFPSLSTQGSRITAVAEALGWRRRRVRAIWCSEPYALTPKEHQQFLDWIAPELAETEPNRKERDE